MLIQNLGHKYFKLHANCIPVKGASRAVICDIQRGKYDFITNDLYEILIVNQEMSLEAIYTLYGIDNSQVLDEYFNFLFLEEYIFFCDFEDLKLFPKIDLSWQNPSIITNAIIDVDESSSHDFYDIFIQLEKLGCKAIQIRFFCNVTLLRLTQIVSILETSAISSLEIFLPYAPETSDIEIINFARVNLRINTLILHSSSEYRIITHESIPGIKIVCTQDLIRDESHCGFISKSYFTINMESFTEALSYNSCLNRKISIDKLGDIKNCPSMGFSYGNVQNKRLSDVVDKQEFTDVWAINKDQIEVCKDCEFRYICTDCRAFTKENGALSKPARCNYNPYTEVWEEAII